MYRLVCPKCGKSDSVVRVVYGMPSPMGEASANRGEIIFGGCNVDEGNPTHYCRSCKIWILKERGKPAVICNFSI